MKALQFLVLSVIASQTIAIKDLKLKHFYGRRPSFDYGIENGVKSVEKRIKERNLLPDYIVSIELVWTKVS